MQDANKSRESRLQRLRDRRKLTSNNSPSGNKSRSVPSKPEIKVRRGVSPTASQKTVPIVKAQETKPNRPSEGKQIRLSEPKQIIRSAAWQCFRLTIAGIGLSMIVGTLMAFWNSYSVNKSADPNTIASNAAEAKKTAPSPASGNLELKAELTPLTTKIKQLAATETDLSLQTFIFDVDADSYVNINGRQPIAAASTIKIPLLVAFLQDVDAGKAHLDEQLELTNDVLVGEAGELQYQPVGTKLSALETLTMMIVISDNTATNMIMKRIGGKEVANQRFQSWGLTATVIRNPLPDLEGTNTTSPQDLVNILAMVDQGKLLSLRSRDRLMDIMRRTVTNTLLPQGLGAEARIVHKTGDIASAVGDAGIIDMPNGKRYIAAAIVKRPDNDQRANELIRQVSRTVYEHFSATTQPNVVPATTPQAPQNEATNSTNNPNNPNNPANPANPTTNTND